MRLSRIDQHIKDEPCAKQRALLGVSSSRFSSVSRDIRSTYPIWIGLPSVLKPNRSKFTRGLDPLYGDARSAKSFEVLTLIFSTDCSPIDWLQSVLKITRFENVFRVFISFLFLFF